MWSSLNSGGVDLKDLSGLGGPRSWMMEIQLTPQTVIGAVEVETTGTGRTRWTAGLVETGWRPQRLAGGQVETTASTEPGGVHRSW